MVTDVSMEISGLETSGIGRPVTLRHVPEERTPQLHRSDSLKVILFFYFPCNIY